MEGTALVRIPDMVMADRHLELEICVVICGVRIRCVNVWEAIFAHACKCKKNSIVRGTGCICSRADRAGEHI